MSVVKWSPFREMQALHGDMDRLFSRIDGGEVAGRRNWMLAMDVFETEDALKLKAALPGLEPKDIDIQIENNVLTVSGHRHLEAQREEGRYHWIEQQYGSFSRSVTLPPAADTERIEASYRNGVLELTVPKRETARRRKIELAGEGQTYSSPPAIEVENPAEAAQSK
jgi:HSP20 family protein